MVRGGYESGEGGESRQPDPAIAGYLGLKGEVMKGIVVPEIDDQLKSTFTDRPEGRIVCGCGDDRTCTHASSRLIEREYHVPTKGPIVRYFGGLMGGARIMMVTLGAQYGERGLADFKNRDFIEIAADFGERARKNTNLIFALHSAAANERNEEHFNLNSDKDVACAYAAALGAVSAGSYNPAITRNTLAEAPGLFGYNTDTLSPRVDSVGSGNRLFVDTALHGRPDFKTTRIEYVRAKAPVMLLEGEHTPAGRTLAVNNLRPDKVSNPDAAHSIGRPFYDNDTTQVAEAIIKAYPEYDFDPLTLLLAMDIDIRSTRTALAGGDPEALQLQRYGDARRAIDYLSNL